MRTAIIIVGGLVLLGLFALVGARFAGGARGVANATVFFIALWFVAALINIWIGVARAGYSVREELPIFLVIFAIPAIVAAFVWWKSS
jgi:hypothetical protein